LPWVARTDALQTRTHNKSPLMAAYLQAGLGPLDPPLSVPATARGGIDLGSPLSDGGLLDEPSSSSLKSG